MVRSVPSRTLLSMAALVLLGLAWVQPVSGEPKYDPQSCRVDTEDRVFVRMRGELMAIPADQFGLAEPEYPDDRRLPTEERDLSEPRGCPDNPIHTTRYVPRMRIVLPPRPPGSALTSNWSVARFELIAVVPEPVKGRPGVVWHGEESNPRVSDLLCAAATIRERLPDGWDACRVKPTELPDDRVEDWAATYTMPLEVYATPLGNRFVVHCDPGVYTGRIGQCRVAYSFSQDVGLLYNFRPFGPGPHLALDRVVDLDRRLRSVIEGYVSAGQKWRRK